MCGIGKPHLTKVLTDRPLCNCIIRIIFFYLFWHLCMLCWKNIGRVIHKPHGDHLGILTPWGLGALCNVDFLPPAHLHVHMIYEWLQWWWLYYNIYSQNSVQTTLLFCKYRHGQLIWTIIIHSESRMGCPFLYTSL